tara:strand:+ start:11194 stop:12291 length:1098 start_codon:yes stop_codon:yes gene_type:complete
MYLGNDFGTQIQIYNRALVFVFIFFSFLKKKDIKLALNIPLTSFITLITLSVVSILFGFIVFAESSFKPIVYTAIFIFSISIPIDKNFVNKLFKLVLSIFCLEIIILFITGWYSSPLMSFYLWRPISFLGIALPRLYGLLLDSHSSWTLFSYLLLLKIIFSDRSKILITFLLSFISCNYQILLQNLIVIFFGLPNQNSYFLRSVRSLFKNKINFSLITFIVFIILFSFSLLNLGYFDINNQSSISYAFINIFSYELLLEPILNHESFICIFTGCSLKNSTYSFINDAGIFYYFTTIGFFRVIYEFGIFYLIIFFSYINRFFGFTIMLFYIAGLIHYPIVMGIPFAFYIPYLFRCAKKSYLLNLQK